MGHIVHYFPRMMGSTVSIKNDDVFWLFYSFFFFFFHHSISKQVRYLNACVDTFFLNRRDLQDTLNMQIA